MTDYLYAAQRLLENPAVDKAFADMAQDIKDAWAITPPSDITRMVELRHDLSALDRLRSKLQGFVYDASQI